VPVAVPVHGHHGVGCTDITANQKYHYYVLVNKKLEAFRDKDDKNREQQGTQRTHRE
jgi:hypothetical protein